MTTTISNAYISAKINHKGAELFSLQSNNDNKEYIWEGNPDFWGKHSPILFPIVGMLKNNSFQINNTTYQLSRHGFARDMNFELINKEVNSVTFSIQSSAETLKIYPFDFELQIHYSLEEKKLNIEYKVINKNQSQLPFSIGAHPAFALNGNFEEYELKFEKEEALIYTLLENDLISNKTQILETKNNLVKLNYKLFENDALIFKKLQSRSLIILKNEIPLIKVHYQSFPHLGIWTKKNSPFLCIEPWYGYSDTNDSAGNIFEKEGIQIIEANEIFNSKFTIEIV
ncbi:aldose 1-epimerase family protein [Flavobacterium sufflavum]|uniref:Aldose 1-epimerase family protein n=1 Tax=Flavobacterium sufflavum TaxID=1921138 RepID=A0A3S2UN81_9FLAO|nr:aldose 1-epimerase family protein [Flavobacterium sufflavum]RVT75339.1 aldose 1-epimerase family protein [Flavobacterium sufflavum]